MPLQTTMHDERVRGGIVGGSAYKQSSSGRSVCRRKPTMTASSSIDSTVDRGSFGPVRRSTTELRAFHLRTVFWIDAVTSGERSQALFTMLYRSTDRLSRRGAPVKNLAHSASFDSCHKNAPSKCGTKHLGHVRSAATDLARTAQIALVQPPEGP